MTTVLADTTGVVMVNFTEVAPAGTVTVAGTITEGLVLARLTTTPPGPAGPFRATELPVVIKPPLKLVGDKLTRDSAVGSTVRVADAPVTNVPVNDTGVFVVT